MTNILKEKSEELRQLNKKDKKPIKRLITDIMKHIASKEPLEIITELRDMDGEQIQIILDAASLVHKNLSKGLLDTDTYIIFCSKLDDVMKLALFPNIKAHLLQNPLMIKELCPSFEKYLTFVEILTDKEIKKLLTLVVNNDLFKDVPMHIHFVEVLIGHLSKNRALGGSEQLFEILNYIFSNKKHLKELVSSGHSLLYIYEKLPSLKLQNMFMKHLVQHEVFSEIKLPEGAFETVTKSLSKQDLPALNSQMRRLNLLENTESAKEVEEILERMVGKAKKSTYAESRQSTFYKPVIEIIIQDVSESAEEDKVDRMEF